MTPKRIRGVLVTAALTVAGVACEAPAPTGDVADARVALDATEAGLDAETMDAAPDASVPDASSDAVPDTVPGTDAADVRDAGWWRPTPGTSWQIQLSGTVDTTVDVRVYDVDLYDTPQATIDALHAAGRAVICYFSAGSREDWRADAARFPAGSYGNGLAGWPGETWVDTRDVTVREIQRARLDLAVAKRCDGVDPDNVDGYANDSGLPLTAATQLDYNRFLAREAHARGLAVGLKNDLDQIPDLVGDFDWAINEQCAEYTECDLLVPFIRANRPVFEIEYGDAPLVSTVCPPAIARNFDTLVKHLALDAFRIACR